MKRHCKSEFRLKQFLFVCGRLPVRTYAFTTYYIA